jgi:hypothetical protein
MIYNERQSPESIMDSVIRALESLGLQDIALRTVPGGARVHFEKVVEWVVEGAGRVQVRNVFE